MIQGDNASIYHEEFFCLKFVFIKCHSVFILLIKRQMRYALCYKEYDLMTRGSGNIRDIRGINETGKEPL